MVIPFPLTTTVVLDEMRVSEAMTAHVITCDEGTPLRDVARQMAQHNVHAVYVTNSDQPGFWGLVSDLDLVAAWPVLDDRTAGNSAVTPLVTVSLHESLGRAAQLMTETGSTHLAVIEPRSGRPAGVLSTLDIARVIAER